MSYEETLTTSAADVIETRGKFSHLSSMVDFTGSVPLQVQGDVFDSLSPFRL